MITIILGSIGVVLQALTGGTTFNLGLPSVIALSIFAATWAIAAWIDLAGMVGYWVLVPFDPRVTEALRLSGRVQPKSRAPSVGSPPSNGRCRRCSSGDAE